MTVSQAEPEPTVDARDEQRLVEQVQGGDFDAFDQLVTLHEGHLYGLAWHLTGDHHDAQDVVQAALLAAVEHIDDFRGDASFKTWITRITVNHALKLLRRRTGGPSALTGEGESADVAPPSYIAQWRDDPQQALDRRELRQILDDGIATLPQGQRLVFVLRDVEGLSTAETAEELGISPGNVKVRLLRARLALREYLTQRFGDDRTRQEPGHDHDALLARLRAKDDAAVAGDTP